MRSDLELLEALGHGRRELTTGTKGSSTVTLPCACGWHSSLLTTTRPDVVDELVVEHLGHVVHAYRDRDLAQAIAAARFALGPRQRP